MLEGTITAERRGSEGFGYDPVFVPAGEQRTVAELGDAWKARELAPRAGGVCAQRRGRRRMTSSTTPVTATSPNAVL